jgi:hypothetical protein
LASILEVRGDRHAESLTPQLRAWAVILVVLGNLTVVDLMKYGKENLTLAQTSKAYILIE